MAKTELSAALELINNRFVPADEKAHAARVVLSGMPEAVKQIREVQTTTLDGTPATLVFDVGLYEITTEKGTLTVFCAPHPNNKHHKK